MQKFFQKFGLNKKESEIFTTLWSLGAQPISTLAKHANTPRTSLYVILEKLTKKGLVESFPRNGIKYIQCADIDTLKNLLNKKITANQSLIEELDEKSEALSTRQNQFSITPKIKFYEGVNEVAKMYDQVLKEKSFCAFFNPKLVKEVMPEYHFKIPASIKKKKGSAQEILTYSDEATEYKKQFHSKKHQIKIFGKDISFDSDTIITDEKVFMISYDIGKKNITATEIWSKPLAQTQKAIFEKMWVTLK